MANISTIVLLLLSFNSAEAQANSHDIPYQKEVISVKVDTSNVPFYLKNNSLFPKKITFIIYRPQQEGNNTLVKWFLPFQKLKFELLINSKIYIATASQVGIIMQGKQIDSDKPFLRVNEKINNTTLQLNSRE